MTEKCCFCGTVRDCGPYINTVISNIGKLGSLFAAHSIVLYYDNSIDDTLKKLTEYARTMPNMILLQNKEPLLKYRTHRIARGRNACMDVVRKNFSDYEYFAMIDCDDKSSGRPKIDVLQKYLTKITEWDSLSFDHPCGYYDTWALSIAPHVMSCYRFNDARRGYRFITKKIQNAKPDQLIQCLSAFNGFAMYRTAKFLDCKYDGTYRTDYIPQRLINDNVLTMGHIKTSPEPEDCEHRIFHFQGVLKNCARIRIAPVCLFDGCVKHH